MGFNLEKGNKLANDTSLVKFLTGTQAQYDAVSSKNENTLYFISDTGVIYKGATPYGVSTSTLETVSGHTAAITNLESTVGKAADTEKGTEATGLVKSVADNAAAIATNVKAIKDNKDAVDTSISAINTKIDGMDFSSESTGGASVTVKVVQEDGKITGVTVDDSAIADTYATKATIGSKDDAASDSGSVYAYINKVTSGIASSSNLEELKTTVDGHGEKLDAAETNIGNLQAAVKTLNEAETVDGSVKKIAKDAAASAVAGVVDGAPEAFDTLKEIATWIGDASNTTAATMVTDINSLKTTVGDSTAGLVKDVADNTNKINALETLLDNKIEGLDASVTSSNTTGSVNVTVVETDGKITGVTVDDSAIADTYATKTSVTSDIKAAASDASAKADAAQAAAEKTAAADATTKANQALADAKEYADGVKTALEGADADTAASVTIKGAKKYADSVAATAKTDLVGTADDASSVDTIKGAKKYAEEKATAAKEAAETTAKNYVNDALTWGTIA